MFDAWLNSEVFRTVVALGLFFLTCVVLLFVLRAYLQLGRRLRARAAAKKQPAAARDQVP